VKSRSASYDVDAQRRLWELSEALLSNGAATAAA
jgi:hypothetical protein